MFGFIQGRNPGWPTGLGSITQTLRPVDRAPDIPPTGPSSSDAHVVVDTDGGEHNLAVGAAPEVQPSG